MSGAAHAPLSQHLITTLEFPEVDTILDAVLHETYWSCLAMGLGAEDLAGAGCSPWSLYLQWNLEMSYMFCRVLCIAYVAAAHYLDAHFS